MKSDNLQSVLYGQIKTIDKPQFGQYSPDHVTQKLDKNGLSKLNVVENLNQSQKDLITSIKDSFEFNHT